MVEKAIIQDRIWLIHDTSSPTKGLIMRCPKCGYISFDHLENCKKCNKQVDESSMQLNGTTYDTLSPSFLKFNITRLEDSSDDQSFDQLEETAEDEEIIDLADFDQDDDESPIEMDEISLDLDEEKIEEGDDIILNLDDLGETDLSENFDADSTSSQHRDETPGIDFGDLDISDLAPAEDQKEAPAQQQQMAEKSSETSVEEEIVFEQDGPIAEITEEIGATVAAEPPPQAAEPAPEKAQSTGLEDLLLDELEFDKPVTTTDIPPKADVKPVKTGTALDNFDIDLGDLFTEKEK